MKKFKLLILTWVLVLLPVVSMADITFHVGDGMNAPGERGDEGVVDVYMSYQGYDITGVQFDICDPNDSLVCETCNMEDGDGLDAFKCFRYELDNGCCRVIALDFTDEGALEGSYGQQFVDISFYVKQDAVIGEHEELTLSNVIVFDGNKLPIPSEEVDVNPGTFIIGEPEFVAPYVSSVSRGNDPFGVNRIYILPIISLDDQIKIRIKDDGLGIDIDECHFGYYRSGSSYPQGWIDWTYTKVSNQEYIVELDSEYMNDLVEGTYWLYAIVKDYSGNDLYSPWISMSYHYLRRLSISGRVKTESGVGIGGAWVGIYGTAFRQTGSDGYFIMENLQPGTHRMWCYINGSNVSPADPTNPTLGERYVTLTALSVYNQDFTKLDPVVTTSSTSSIITTTTTTIPTYGVSGRFMNTDTGNYEQGAWIWVEGNGITAVSSTTDSNGYYGFSGLTNGLYQLHAGKSGYTVTPANTSVTISGSWVTKNFNIKSNIPTYIIWGRVVDYLNGNAPIPNKIMKDYTTGEIVYTNASGYYSFPGRVDGSTHVFGPYDGGVFLGYSWWPVTYTYTVNGAHSPNKMFYRY